MPLNHLQWPEIRCRVYEIMLVSCFYPVVFSRPPFFPVRSISRYENLISSYYCNSTLQYHRWFSRKIVDMETAQTASSVNDLKICRQGVKIIRFQTILVASVYFAPLRFYGHLRISWLLRILHEKCLWLVMSLMIVMLRKIFINVGSIIKSLLII